MEIEYELRKWMYECACVWVWVWVCVCSLLANANNEPAGNDSVHDMMEYTFEWSLLCSMVDVSASQTVSVDTLMVLNVFRGHFAFSFWVVFLFFVFLCFNMSPQWLPHAHIAHTCVGLGAVPVRFHMATATHRITYINCKITMKKIFVK